MGVYQTDTGWGFVVELPRVDGKRRQRRRQGFRTRREARDAMLRLTVTKKGTSPWTVEQVAERWVGWMEANPDLQGSTVQTHRANLTHYLIPAFGGRNIDEVTPLDLEAVYFAARRQGVRGRPLSARTVQLIHQTASALFKWAVRKDLATVDPTERTDKPKVSYGEKNALTAEQARAFLQAVSGRDDFALWYLAVVTGARVGELAALTWDRVDLDHGRVTFAAAEKTYDPEGRPFPQEPDHVTFAELWALGRVGPLKNRRDRTVSIDPGAVAVLEGWRRRQQGHADEWGWEPEWVFTWPHGARYKKQWIGKELRRLLPDVSFHELRHTAATLMLQAGIDVPSAAARLGHDPNVMLRTYAHVLEEMDRRAGDVLGQLVGGER